MQKQTNFFEQNVQWFALGIGGLFLAWMLYAYVLTDPATINVGMHKAVAPGEVDKLTLDGPVNDLKRDIARSDVPDIPQKDYVQNFLAAINGSKEKPVQLARMQIRSAPMNPPGTVLAQGPDGVPGADKGPTKPVTELPIQPAAHVGSNTEGRSQVTYDDPNWQPNPNKPGEQPPQITADKDWWSGEFIIDGGELYKAFAKAFDVKKIEAVYPDATPFFQTALVDVQLVRQEIGAGNKVVKEEVVKPLDNQPPTIRPPYPKADADQATFSEYLNTVTKNPIELQSPPFYQVIAGDPWMEPGEATDTLLTQMKQANKEQRKQQKEQLRQQQLQKVQAAQQARNARAGAAAGGAAEDMAAEEAAMDPVLRGGSGAVRGRSPYPAPPPPGLAPSGLPIGRRPVAAVPGRPGARAVVPISPVVLGPGRFPVTDGMGPIRIIAHDDTVQPGKTYRYKLRYKLFNPLYMGTAAAPELTKQFALKGPDSAWTGTFTIRPKVEYFLASTSRDKATFDLFQFKDGVMRKSSTSVAPGDMIQSRDASTGVSLVDTAGTGDKAYALLMDENGQVVRREPKADKESDRYDELNFDATQPPAVGLNQ
jgi:hypothetical protein